MALIKVSEVDKYEVVGEFKHVQCRTATWVEEDGVMVGSKNFHRHVISPSDDASSMSAECQAICAAVHTQEIKDAYIASLGAE